MKRFLKDESGTSLGEFAVVAGVFMMIIFGVIEFGRLMYTHNALADATRRGARYAVLHPENSNTCVRRVVIYGEWNVGPVATGCNLIGTPSPMIHNIGNATITVVYQGEDLDGDPDTPNPYGMNLGTATVTITGYQFNLSVPFFRRTLTMPSYTTTLPAESSGIEPDPLP